MSKSALLQELTSFAAHLEKIREPRLAVWRELHRLVIPHRGRFTEDSAASESELKAALNNANNAPLLSLRRGAAGLTSAMTPSGLPWYVLGFASSELEEITGARGWLDMISERTGAVMASGGFYQAIHCCNQELIGYGCMLLYSEMDGVHDAAGFWQSRIRHECVPVGSFCVAMNAAGDLEAVTRELLFTARELESRFGREKLSREAREALDKEPYRQFAVMHVVQRRMNRDSRRLDSRNMPWVSWFYEKNSEDVLGEGGYTEMPYFFASWTPGRTPYGYGPGDEALGEIKTLNAMEIKVLIGLDKTIDPPMRTPQGFRTRLNTKPGGSTPVPSTQREALGPLYEINFVQGIAAVQQKIERVEARVDEILLGRVFADPMLESLPKNVTATAVLAQRQQKAQMMGPAVSAYEPSVLNRVIFRTVSLLDAAGELPPPPGGLAREMTLPRGLFTIRYMGPLAQSLRRSNAETTQALLFDALNIARTHPEALDKVDVDQAIDEIARGMGAPGSVIRSDEQVAAIRQARAEAGAAAAAAQNPLTLMTP